MRARESRGEPGSVTEGHGGPWRARKSQGRPWRVGEGRGDYRGPWGLREDQGGSVSVREGQRWSETVREDGEARAPGSESQLHPRTSHIQPLPASFLLPTEHARGAEPQLGT